MRVLFFEGMVATVILGQVYAVERVALAEDQRGGDSMPRSLCNRDAGDSDARHFGDGHLEQ